MPKPDIFNDTIGQFYAEIRHCINMLGDDIFVGGGRPDLQVQWPWKISDSSFGEVHTVTNVESANEAIDEIVEQGEGANPYNPTYDNVGDLAHFYTVIRGDSVWKTPEASDCKWHKVLPIQWS